MEICRQRILNRLLVAGLLIVTLQADEALGGMTKKPILKSPPSFNAFIEFPPLPYKKQDDIQKLGVPVDALLNSIPKAVQKITLTLKDAGKIKDYRELMTRGEDISKLLGKSAQKRLRKEKWEKTCKDPNGDPLGLAIKCDSPGFKSKAFGKWKVKKTGDAWEDIVPVNLECAKNETCLYIVNSKDRLKFEPNDNDIDTDETKLEVYARKILDRRTSGKTECSDLRSHHFSRKFSAILVSRLSCRNLLDNVKVDACGVCGGKGESCKKGCDGELNSKAKKSKCGGVCYGGKAKIKIDPLISNKYCRKYCENENFKDACIQYCPSKYKKYMVKDCNGQCGGARRNWCGHCYGGKTKRPANYGIDKCGVCGGNNESCADCKGIPNGQSRKDKCGKCLDPKSKAFNNCAKILKIDPSVITSLTKSVNVFGVVNMKDIKKFQATCKLKSTTKQILMEKAEGKIRNNREFKLLLKLQPGKVVEGEYCLTCTLTPGRLQVEFKGIKGTVTDNVKVKRAYPAHGEVDKPLNVTIKGSGFVNIKHMKCILACTSMKQYENVKARFVNSSEMICPLKKPEHPTKVKKLCLQFSDDSPKCADFHFKGPAPKPKKCSIRTDVVSFQITFDQPVKASSKCIDLFSDKIYNKILSKSAKCQWIKNKEVLIVRNTRSVLNKQTSMEIRYKALQNGRVEESTHDDVIGETINVTCSRASQVKRLKVVLTGTMTQNPGSTFRIYMEARGIGPLQISWRLQLVYGQKETEEIKADIKKLSEKIKRVSKLLKISDSHIPAGTTYNFTVTVTDRIHPSITNSVNPTRTQNGEIPEFRIGIIYKQRANRIRFKIKYLKIKVRCKFEWKCSNTESSKNNGMSLDVKNPTPGLYTCSARVSTASRSKTISASFSKKSRPLKCDIIAGGRRHVGQNDNTTLEVSVMDPDDNEATFSYAWTCLHSLGATCILKSDHSEAKFPKARKIDVDMSTIQTSENDTLKFVLEVLNDKSSKKCELTRNITVKKGSPPICKLYIPNKAFDSTKQVKFRAAIQSRSSETKYYIKTVDRKGFDYLDIEAASSTSVEGAVTGSGRRKNPTIIIKRDMLGYKSVYKFRLTCQDTETGEESQAEADLRTLPKLTAGTIKVDVTNGTAGKTIFIVIPDNNWELADQDGEIESSSEDESSQVLYQCGWYYNEKGKKLPQAYGDFSCEDSCELQLPSGPKERNYEVEVFLKACVDEERKRCVESTTLVTVKPSSKGRNDEIEEAARTVTEAANSDDIDTVHGAVMTTDLQNPPENVQQKINDFCDKSLDVGTKKVEIDMFDDDSKKAIQEIFKKCTQRRPGGKLSKSRESEVLYCASRLAKHGEEEPRDSKRKRRAVDEQDPVVTEQNPEQVELALQTHDNQVNMSDYTEDTMAYKCQFIDLAKTLSQSMCNGIDNGEEARVAQLSTMVLRSQKNSFEYVHVNYALTGCDQCETYKSKSAKVLLGETLRNTYDDWNCDSDGDDGCNGACVVSLQMSYDLLVNNTYKGITRTSDIIDVQLINPKTYQVISVSSLANPVKYKVYLYKGVDMGKADLKCHRWDAGQNKWTTSGVTTLQTNTTDMSVTCAADQLVYITIFDMNGGTIPTEVTTATSTLTTATDIGSTAEFDTTATVIPTNAATKKASTSSPATTTAPKKNHTTLSSSANTGVQSSAATASSSSVADAQQSSSGTTSSSSTDADKTLKQTDSPPTTPTDVPKTTSRKGADTSKPASHPNENTEKVVAFSLGVNYDEVITSTEKKVQFESNMKKQVATKLRVKESRIQNLLVMRGSIIVTFNLLPGNNNEPSVNELTDQLMRMVQTGNMTFTSLEGNKLSVIASSFTKQYLPNEPTFTNDPANKSGGLKQDILIGIIGGVCVVVVIVIMVGLYYRFKPKQRIKTCDSDLLASRRSLQGVCSNTVEESDKPSVDVTGIKPSLPGSPIYDNVR